eukprot:UN21774
MLDTQFNGSTSEIGRNFMKKNEIVSIWGKPIRKNAEGGRPGNHELG